MNTVRLYGHLGKDPEMVFTKNGKALAKLNLATNANYRNHLGEWVTTTEWHRCIAFGKLAEAIAESLRKGDSVIVFGALVHSSYEDASGARRLKTEVRLKEAYKTEKL